MSDKFKYLVCVRAGKNDLKALEKLDSTAKPTILPLVSLRGENLIMINSFCQNWSNQEFLLDFSRQDDDQKGLLFTKDHIDSPNNGFAEKIKTLNSLRLLNSNITPVIAWKNTDPQSEILSFYQNLLINNYSQIAVRVKVDSNSNASQNCTTHLVNILNEAHKKQKQITLIIDHETIDSTPIISNSSLINITKTNWQSLINRIFCLSSSFPTSKPSSPTPIEIDCIDLQWQKPVINTYNLSGYGDYATCPLSGSIKSNHGFELYPFAAYFSTYNEKWWLRRGATLNLHSDNIQIANEIINRQQHWHGANFCWANINIERISKLNPTNLKAKGWGGVGEWIGFRANQHICGILRHFKKY